MIRIMREIRCGMVRLLVAGLVCLAGLPGGTGAWADDASQACGVARPAQAARLAVHGSVCILGAVDRPGGYEWRAGVSLLDVLDWAGGSTPQADLTRIELSVPGVRPARRFDLAAFLKEGGRLSDVPELSAGAIVTVPRQSQNTLPLRPYADVRTVHVVGAVRRPGPVTLDGPAPFLDVLAQAGGLSDAADVGNIRIDHEGRGAAGVSRIDLAALFETGESRALPAVAPGDTIFVPALAPGVRKDGVEGGVRVMGAVSRPGRYALQDRDSIVDLISRAGGTLAQARNDKIVVVQAGGSEPEAETFDLERFARKGKPEDLPRITEGGTIYVPFEKEGRFGTARSALGAVTSVLSVVLIAGAM